MAAEIDPIRKGDSIDYTLQLVDENDQPIPANGALTFTLKTSQTDPDPGVLQHTAYRDDDDLIDPTGLLTLEIPAEKTALVEPGEYYYDFQFISTAGKVKTVLPTIGEEETVEVYDHTTHMSTYTP